MVRLIDEVASVREGRDSYVSKGGPYPTRHLPPHRFHLPFTPPPALPLDAHRAPSGRFWSERGGRKAGIRTRQQIAGGLRGVTQEASQGSEALDVVLEESAAQRGAPSLWG